MALTIEQIAAIYQRSVAAVRKACWRNRFVPAPYQARPYRWRKTAVVADVEGARSSLRRVS